jgi:hypothetical protein
VEGVPGLRAVERDRGDAFGDVEADIFRLIDR